MEQTQCASAVAHRDRSLETPGAWLGVGADIDKATVETSNRLLPGDLLLLYTDGVTEAMNAKGEQFGMDRLRAQLASVESESVKAICDHLMKSVRAWGSVQADDITLLVSRYEGSPAQASA